MYIKDIYIYICVIEGNEIFFYKSVPINEVDKILYIILLTNNI